jgi:hypothetical protein
MGNAARDGFEPGNLVQTGAELNRLTLNWAGSKSEPKRLVQNSRMGQRQRAHARLALREFPAEIGWNDAAVR